MNMKKYLLLIVAAFSLTGCGTAVISQKSIDAQQIKEVAVIEAQKNKEKEVMDYQYDLRAKEEASKKESLEICLMDAHEHAVKTINALYEASGINPNATPSQITVQIKQLDYSMTIALRDVLKEVVDDLKNDEAKCYVLNS